MMQVSSLLVAILLAARSAEAAITTTDTSYCYPTPPWFETGLLPVDSLPAGAEYGSALAMRNDVVVVGAEGDNGTGAVYIAHQIGNAWSDSERFVASDAENGDDFGADVAIDGAIRVIGADQKSSNRGAAYVFATDGSSTHQIQKLTASDAAINNYFGSAVAVSGQTIFVTAPNNNNKRGAAYVFRAASTAWNATWTQIQKIVPADISINDYFGYAVTVENDLALVSTYRQNHTEGALYAYSWSGTAWTQTQKILVDSGVNKLGLALATRGRTALIGAYNGSVGRGHGVALIYEHNGTWWNEVQRIVPSVTYAACVFGETLALDKTLGVIGDYDSNDSTGSAWLFIDNGTRWNEVQMLTGQNIEAGDMFGWSVAVQDATVIVAEMLSNSSRGSVHVFIPTVCGILTETATHTATQPTHTATQPTHTATVITNTATQPTHTATQPTHTATQITKTATEPTHTATQPTHTATQPTHTATVITKTATEPTHTAIGTVTATARSATQVAETTSIAEHSKPPKHVLREQSILREQCLACSNLPVVEANPFTEVYFLRLYCYTCAWYLGVWPE